jgi:hypothetical protein
VEKAQGALQIPPYLHWIVVKKGPPKEIGWKIFLSFLTCGTVGRDGATLVVGELLFSGCVHVPCVLVMCCLTIAEEVIVVDWPVTAFYLFCGIGYNITRANSQIRSMATVFVGVSLSRRGKIHEGKTA